MMNVSAPKAKRITVKKSTIKGTLTFGANNMLPQDLLTLISDSVTARACLSTRAQFIQGNGFFDPNIAKMVVHRSGLTLDSVLHRTSNNVSYFEGVVAHVMFNGLGKVAGLRPIPYEFIRLCEPDDMGIITHAAICPYLDGGYNASKKNLFTKLPLFNPNPEVVLQQMAEAGGIDNYQGQLLYEPFWTPGDGYYHQPSWMTAVRAIESEAQLDLFNWNTIINGFNVSGILSVVGDPTKTNYEPLLDPNSIEYQLADNQGAENAAKVMVMRFKTQQEAESTRFVDISGANLAQRFEYTSGWAADMITRAMNVPNELVGIRRQGGIAPTGDEVIVASQLMYQTVNLYQRRIEQLFDFIFAHWHQPIANPDFSIENLDYFKDAKNGTSTSVAQPG